MKDATPFHPLLAEYQAMLEEFSDPDEYMTFAEFLELAEEEAQGDAEYQHYLDNSTPEEQAAVNSTGNWLKAIGKNCFETGDFGPHRAAWAKAGDYYAEALRRENNRALACSD